MMTALRFPFHYGSPIHVLPVTLTASLPSGYCLGLTYNKERETQSLSHLVDIIEFLCGKLLRAKSVWHHSASIWSTNLPPLNSLSSTIFSLFSCSLGYQKILTDATSHCPRFTLLSNLYETWRRVTPDESDCTIFLILPFAVLLPVSPAQVSLWHPHSYSLFTCSLSTYLKLPEDSSFLTNTQSGVIWKPLGSDSQTPAWHYTEKSVPDA